MAAQSIAAQSITVGVDGTPASDAALVYAIDEAVARGVPLVTVTAWWVGRVFPEDHTSAMDEEHSAASLVQDQAIRRALREVDDSPVIERRLVRGDAGVVLVDEARGSSHLVVGCTHKGLYRRVVEGSVSAQCVRNSAVPVTVVPWPPHDADAAPEAALGSEQVHGAPRPLAEIDA